LVPYIHVLEFQPHLITNTTMFKTFSGEHVSYCPLTVAQPALLMVPTLVFSGKPQSPHVTHISHSRLSSEEERVGHGQSSGGWGLQDWQRW